jgi:ABC transporter transmembrane region
MESMMRPCPVDEGAAAGLSAVIDGPGDAVGVILPREQRDESVPRPGSAQGLHVLRAVFRARSGPLLLTYVLFALENALWMAQPFALSLAIDGLLNKSYYGVLWFAIQQVGYVSIGVWRRSYDTRVYSRIHADLVARLVLEQHRREVAVTCIAARTALSREFIDFFERHVPMMMQVAFLTIGGLTILAAFDRTLVLLCSALVIPTSLMNAAYARKTLALSGQLHDALEREVEVIGRGDAHEVHGHYERVAGCRIRLSDSEARSFGTTGIFVLALMVASLFLSCGIA